MPDLVTEINESYVRMIDAMNDFSRLQNKRTTNEKTGLADRHEAAYFLFRLGRIEEELGTMHRQNNNLWGSKP